jgi:hypothetical protein
MRLSANSDSPHFHWRCMEAVVLLDGVKLVNCIEADEEAGKVLVLNASTPLDEINPFQLQERTGHVEVLWKQPA